ncbi:hypothetical protein EG327_000026 [Venturia inaequalis]|uniref:Extracellular serine-rich protein n=1 Tax=Venturia inaequalis TaxID=5025 RepID=A0A8H3VVZ1_VENIN|nr:hypothetical protein EG327_000026 [Venturia inaequalis]
MRFNFTLLSAFAACAVAIDHAVTVGGDKLDIYSPVEIKAEKGDTVTFQFLTGTHDIIQSTFNKPCEPMFGGFYSSIISVNQTAKARASTASLVPPSYVLPITDTLPQWFYCSRGDHCKKGMVGVINPSSSQDQTLENYKIAAKIVAKAGGVEYIFLDLFLEIYLRLNFTPWHCLNFRCILTHLVICQLDNVGYDNFIYGHNFTVWRNIDNFIQMMVPFSL